MSAVGTIPDRKKMRFDKPGLSFQKPLFEVRPGNKKGPENRPFDNPSYDLKYIF